jgi:hypothetical protein
VTAGDQTDPAAQAAMMAYHLSWGAWLRVLREADPVLAWLIARRIERDLTSVSDDIEFAAAQTRKPSER